MVGERAIFMSETVACRLRAFKAELLPLDPEFPEQEDNGDDDLEDVRFSSSSTMMFNDFSCWKPVCDKFAILRARAVRPCILRIVSLLRTAKI